MISHALESSKKLKKYIYFKCEKIVHMTHALCSKSSEAIRQLVWETVTQNLACHLQKKKSFLQATDFGGLGI